MGVLFTKQIHFSSLTDAAVPVGYEDSVGRISRKQKLRSPPPSSENLELSQVPSCGPQAGQSIAWRVLPTSRNPALPPPPPPNTNNNTERNAEIDGAILSKMVLFDSKRPFSTRFRLPTQHAEVFCFFVFFSHVIEVRKPDPFLFLFLLLLLLFWKYRCLVIH